MKRLILISIMLAMMPIQGGCQRTERPATGARSEGQILRFKRISVQDQPNMIGGEAMTFLCPVGWQVEGGLVWRAHPVMPATVHLRVINPGGLEQLESFPTLGFSWGGMLTPQLGFPIGANYLGNEVRPPARDAIQYLKEIIVPRYRANLQPQLIGEQELPQWAQSIAQQQGQGMGVQMNFSGGKIRIAYTVNGQPVEEDLYCVLQTTFLPSAGNMYIQTGERVHGMRAAKGQLDDRTRIMQTIVTSVRPNLQWYNRYMQVCQQLTQQQMQRIRAAGELSRYISQTHNEISDMIRQSYENRQAAEDRINKNWSQYIRGVDEYYNPVEQRPVELPSGYKNAWVNGSGEYIVTDSLNFNPNVELDGNWQELKKAGE